MFKVEASDSANQNAIRSCPSRHWLRRQSFQAIFVDGKMEVIAPYLEDHQKMAWSTADISAAVSANLGFAVQTDSAWTLFVNTAQQVVNFFTPYAKALTFPEESFAPFDGPVQNLADSIGMGSKASMIKFVLILLAVYPITGLFAILPFKFLKHTVSLATGVFLAQWMFGAEWFNSLFSSAVAYAILAIASLVPAVGRYQHVLVFAWMMGYMTAAHFWRLHTDYLGWSMDYTGPQMILTIKLTSLAFNLWDGRQVRNWKRQKWHWWLAYTPD